MLPLIFPLDAEVHQGVLIGHTNAVWDLAVHSSTGFLLSCASDGSCRLWNHRQTSPQVGEFRTEQSESSGIGGVGSTIGMGGASFFFFY